MIATGGTKWAVPQPPPPLAEPRTPVESFLRAFKRRSLRVKRSKSLVINEKRKSGLRESDAVTMRLRKWSQLCQGPTSRLVPVEQQVGAYVWTFETSGSGAHIGPYDIVRLLR
ncbi:hypothetical protein WDU94_006804 [Cyamophila willieti]